MPTLGKLLYEGSVKSVYASEEAGISYFEYSDRYSLFDWGEMPDHLNHKGECLAVMGALFFNLLTQHQVPHHFLGLVDTYGNPTTKPYRFLKVKSIDVIRPSINNGTFDYSAYKGKPVNSLVPLEVLFRFGIGRGSSLGKRVRENPELLKQWGFSKLEEGAIFDEPLLDFSTKLEKGDRYLTFSEAKRIGGFSEAEWAELLQLTRKVAQLLKNLFSEMDMQLWDGKIELAFTPSSGSERSFMVVDSIGLDELRLEKQGAILSKEFLRDYYRGTEWYKELVAAKAKGADFKSICSNPKPLPMNVKKKAENLYVEFTNDLAKKIIGRKIFSESGGIN